MEAVARWIDFVVGEHELHVFFGELAQEARNYRMNHGRCVSRERSNTDAAPRLGVQLAGRNYSTHGRVHHVSSMLANFKGVPINARPVFS
ncbi:hypothetical protein CNE_BB1p06200 (plasmid) [Cupriavidus necator N-1]|uniref:Uncharacterized protein n=1 Tax=Cupriavidus necator (strain ATCC 43291 / DSM 13513 / CCUG 52238 / LMG 8453 / N-1) TaxID=1042878 RepID=F8GXH0_CUPNN|nr:hypothetical protein [Cupriavidus necator]AEI82040.1 hypothetical protein CNE_BB1p06200 [Cupriavidus necator N-1]MDX6008356.1 hypothetical protein [Cupriavidus necator]